MDGITISNTISNDSYISTISCSKRRKSEKGGKGLRHFSMKVCEKVKAKGTTSYNEVADELVSEFTDPTRCASPSDGANVSCLKNYKFYWFHLN